MISASSVVDPTFDPLEEYEEFVDRCMTPKRQQRAALSPLTSRPVATRALPLAFDDQGRFVEDPIFLDGDDDDARLGFQEHVEPVMPVTCHPAGDDCNAEPQAKRRRLRGKQSSSQASDLETEIALALESKEARPLTRSVYYLLRDKLRSFFKDNFTVPAGQVKPKKIQYWSTWHRKLANQAFARLTSAERFHCMRDFICKGMCPPHLKEAALQDLVNHHKGDEGLGNIFAHEVLLKAAHEALATYNGAWGVLETDMGFTQLEALIEWLKVAFFHHVKNSTPFP